MSSINFFFLIWFEFFFYVFSFVNKIILHLLKCLLQFKKKKLNCKKKVHHLIVLTGFRILFMLQLLLWVDSCIDINQWPLYANIGHLTTMMILSIYYRSSGCCCFSIFYTYEYFIGVIIFFPTHVMGNKRLMW